MDGYPSSSRCEGTTCLVRYGRINQSKGVVLTRRHYFLLRRTFKMGISKRAFFIAIGLVLVMVVSACGSTTSTGSTSSTPTATPTTASTSTLQTTQVTMNGKTTTIL